MYDEWRTSGILNQVLEKLLSGAARYDWEYPAIEYAKAYNVAMQFPILTCDKIRSTPPVMPILTQFKALSVTEQKLKPFTGLIVGVGFNKCGTQSLVAFFWDNKIKCMHHGVNGILAVNINDNFVNHRPLIGPEYAEYTGFFDMENIYADPPIYIPQTLFVEFDKQYPNSKFILNTRDREAWIKSRLKHVDITNNRKYSDVLCEKYQINLEQLQARWRKEWDEHHRAVLDYFKDRPHDLLVYNLDSDKPVKICEFFKEYFKLNPSLFQHLNKEPTALVLKAESGTKLVLS